MKRIIAWLSRLFVSKIDTNQDGFISEDEILETLRPIAKLISNKVNKKD